MLDAYVADYLTQEVAAEGLVRNLQGFSGFLDAAALSDGEVVNATNRRPRVRRVEPHRPRLLRHLGGHIAWAMAPRRTASAPSGG